MASLRLIRCASGAECFQHNFHLIHELVSANNHVDLRGSIQIRFVSASLVHAGLILGEAFCGSEMDNVKRDLC